MELEKRLNKKEYSKEELLYFIKLKDKGELDKLYKKAYKIKEENVAKKVF